jgi:hypothetical protein
MGTIPKVIHYCWFGGKEPRVFTRCMSCDVACCVQVEHESFDIGRSRWLELFGMYRTGGCSLVLFVLSFSSSLLCQSYLSTCMSRGRLGANVHFLFERRRKGVQFAWNAEINFVFAVLILHMCVCVCVLFFHGRAPRCMRMWWWCVVISCWWRDKMVILMICFSVRPGTRKPSVREYVHEGAACPFFACCIDLPPFVPHATPHHYSQASTQSPIQPMTRAFIVRTFLWACTCVFL